MLTKLTNSNNSIHILQALEDNLSSQLSIDNKRKHIPPFINKLTHHHIRNAVKHQNIIGWENFMRGYTSLYGVNAKTLNTHKISELKRLNGDTYL
jgi:hypothetical protein